MTHQNHVVQLITAAIPWIGLRIPLHPQNISLADSLWDLRVPEAPKLA